MTSGRDGSGNCKKGRVPGRVGTGSKNILKAKSTYMGYKRATNNHQLPNSDDGHISSSPVYTFSYRKAVIRPQNLPKAVDLGLKLVKINKFF